MPDAEHVLVRRETLPSGAPLLRLRLNDPATRNSLSQPMLAQLADAIDAARGAALILDAAPPAFCSGLNLDFVFDAVVHASSARGPIEMLIGVYRRLIDHPHPTAALVEGPAVGGGFGLVACCDAVAVTPDGWFQLPGGHYAELGGVVLPVLRRRTHRPEVLFAVRIDAAEALRRGLADCESQAELAARLDDPKAGAAIANRARWDEAEMRQRVERASFREVGRGIDAWRRRRRP